MNRLTKGVIAAAIMLVVAVLGLYLYHNLTLRQIHQVSDLTIDLAIDLTDENFGDYRSLFELRDRNGDAVCGAGFQRGGQTYRNLNGGDVLEFYCTSDAETEIVDLGRPGDGWRPALVSGRDGIVDLATGYRWQDGRQAWEAVQGYQRAENVIALSGGDLVFHPATASQPPRVTYDASEVASLPDHALWSGTYYRGRIYLAATPVSKRAPSLFMCDWSPGERCTLEQVSLPGETRMVYALKGYEGRLLIGGSTTLMLYDAEGVRTLLHKLGHEYYAFLAHRDEILVGTFPEGFLYSIEPEDWSVNRLVAPPVRDDGFVNDGQLDTPTLNLLADLGESYYREAQSLAVMGGRIFVGMYPWGDVWEETPEGWKPHELASDPQRAPYPWPYYEEMQERRDALADHPLADHSRWLIDAFWARRVPSMIPSPNALAASTGNLAGMAYEEERDTFMIPADLEQYGRVKLLQRPLSISAHIPIKGPITLSFRVGPGGMAILQDGVEVARSPEPAPDLASTQFVRGEGVFGPTRLPIRHDPS